MFRSFAIVPAAGRSERMGVSKLLLPLGGQPLVERVLAAWTGSRVTRTVAVIRAGDAELAACCRRFDVDLVVPPRPPVDMKESVRLALDHIASCYAPTDDDGWLLAPADLPGLSPSIVDRVAMEYEATRPLAIVPSFEGVRGHPLALPWSCAHEVGKLALDEGVNALVARTPRREFECRTRQILDDIDAPADFARAAAAWNDETANAKAGL